MKRLGLLGSRLALLCGAAALACDPAGPGAAGNLSLDSSVDASSFTTLEVRAYPDSSGKFDPEKIQANGGLALDVALKDITFPYHYGVDQGVGTTDEQHWRMTAWLAAAAGSERPATSDPQCSVAFDIAECGAQFGGYCGTTNDVHCTLK